MFDKKLMRLTGMPAIMGALVVLALLQAACIVGQAMSLASCVSQLWEGTPLGDALPALVAFATCFGLLQLLKFAQETMLDRYSVEKSPHLRNRILELTFDPNAPVARSVGPTRVIALATDGIDEVQAYLRIIPPKIIGMVAISLPLLVCEFVLDWPSGIILTVMYPVIIFFMVLLGRQASARAARQYASYTRLTNRFMDTLRGLPVIRAFGATEREADSVYRQSEGLRSATVSTLKTATLSSAVLDLCATFGVAAVAIMLAFRLMDGSIALYTGLAALMLAPEYFTPIRSFAADYHASQDGKNSLAEVLDVLALSFTDDAGASHAQAQDDPDAAGNTLIRLTFEGVSARYDNSHDALPPVSFGVRAPMKVGIIGKSGSGKSTLANLVAGFMQPSSGTVLLNGEPFDLRSPAWHQRVRYIPQRPSIFRLSLADNVRFYNPQASDEAVAAAIQAVGLEPLVAQLPEGMHALIGEGHRGLSGGEAHRVALARVLVDEQARVLVFDEPTAHLDIETEWDLKEPMLKLMEGKLVFFATHRLHWIDDMDLVLRLDDSAIQEVGV